MVPRTHARRPEARPGSAATFLFRTWEFTCRPDAAEACDVVIQGMIESSDRTSDGTRFVGWFHDADDPYHFMVTAVFEDEIAERTHDSSPASRRFRDAIHAAAVDGVRVRSWEAVAGL